MDFKRLFRILESGEAIKRMPVVLNFRNSMQNVQLIETGLALWKKNYLTEKEIKNAIVSFQSFSQYDNTNSTNTIPLD